MSILKDKFDERALLKDLEEIKKNQQDILRDLHVIKHEQARLKETLENQKAVKQPAPFPSIPLYPTYPWPITKTAYGKTENR